MIQLETVFFVKFKDRKSSDVTYSVLLDEDDKWFRVLKGSYNKEFYHYKRISEEEYLNAPKDKREVPWDERDSER